MHTSQSGRNRDEVTDARNESSCQGGHDTVVVEVTLRLLYLLLVQQTHLAPLAVGKLIDNRSPNIKGYEVVDRRSEVCSDGGKENDQPHIEFSAGSVLGGRGDDKLRRHRYNCALQQHQKKNGAVVQIT